MDKALFQQSKLLSKEFLSFVNKSPTAYHVTHHCRSQLLQSGFQELSESQTWNLQKGQKYFFTKNESTLFAFVVGNKFSSKTTGFKIIGGHTDSPCLKLAPVSKFKQHEYHQHCVCTYGGGLWHTWLDRDLTLAGKVVHFDKASQKYVTKLVHIQRPLVKIPNLAIHLQSAAERGKLDLNNETHLRPIFSQEVTNKLFENNEKQEEVIDTHGILKKHFGDFLSVIAQELNINEVDIVDMDLNFADVQEGQLFGLHEEFISSPRLDNQMSSFLAFKSLLDYEMKDSAWISLITLYDHEECGSESAQGANSQMLPATLKRIYENLQNQEQDIEKDGFQQAIARSFQISADMSHSIHPNYAVKHQDNHQIKMNKGVGLKVNYNQAYATDLISASIVKLLAESKNIPLQEFIVRNDSPCGSTIGRFVSAQTGIKTIDVGSPQLSMHSIRETCGVIDTLHCYNLFKVFFEDYENLPVDLLGK